MKLRFVTICLRFYVTIRAQSRTFFFVIKLARFVTYNNLRFVPYSLRFVRIHKTWTYLTKRNLRFDTFCLRFRPVYKTYTYLTNRDLRFVHNPYVFVIFTKRPVIGTFRKYKTCYSVTKRKNEQKRNKSNTKRNCDFFQ